MDVVRAAGGILWRPGRPGRLAVIHRPRRDDWTLPKGKLEPREPWQAAALREVFEETGCTARITSFVGATAYEARRGQKIVLYWNMVLVEEGELEHLDEVDEVLWLPPEEALLRLDRNRDRRMLERAMARNSPILDAASVIERCDAALSRGDLERACRVFHEADLAA